MTEQLEPEHEAVVLPFRKPHIEEIGGVAVNLSRMSDIELELLAAQLQRTKDDVDLELTMVTWELGSRPENQS